MNEKLGLDPDDSEMLSFSIRPRAPRYLNHYHDLPRHHPGMAYRRPYRSGVRPYRPMI